MWYLCFLIDWDSTFFVKIIMQLFSKSKKCYFGKPICKLLQTVGVACTQTSLSSYFFQFCYLCETFWTILAMRGCYFACSDQFGWFSLIVWLYSGRGSSHCKTDKWPYWGLCVPCIVYLNAIVSNFNLSHMDITELLWCWPRVSHFPKLLHLFKCVRKEYMCANH